MREQFAGYYRPSEEEFADLWQNCMFVLDTNVLLNLYRYPVDARNDLIGVLKKVKSRVWIPHQVALEYEENRLAVISEQMERFREVKEILDSIQNKLKGQLDALHLKKRHSTIDPDNLLQKVSSSIKDFVSELEKLETAQLSATDHDTIRDEINDIVRDRVGEPPQSQAYLENLYKGGKTRYELQRPPGYKDIIKSSKSEPAAYFYGDLVLYRQYGDLILWFQLIDEANKNDRFKKIIFITDDNKDDWWLQIDSAGRKTIGPRPELVQEIKEKAGVDLFYMYNSERFMQYAREYLSAQIKEESISQVRDIARSAVVNSSDLSSFGEAAEKAVQAWLQESHSDSSISFNSRGFPEFICFDSNSNVRIGYEVKLARTHGRLIVHPRFRDVLYRGYHEVKEGKLDKFVLVIVLDEPDLVDIAHRQLTSANFEIPNGTSVQIGYLTEVNKEKEIFKFVPA
jgi:hypothetical protein